MKSGNSIHGGDGTETSRDKKGIEEVAIRYTIP
jgi:hypothetical protein